MRANGGAVSLPDSSTLGPEFDPARRLFRACPHAFVILFWRGICALRFRDMLCMRDVKRFLFLAPICSFPPDIGRPGRECAPYRLEGQAPAVPRRSRYVSHTPEPAVTSPAAFTPPRKVFHVAGLDLQRRRRTAVARWRANGVWKDSGSARRQSTRPRREPATRRRGVRLRLPTHRGRARQCPARSLAGSRPLAATGLHNAACTTTCSTWR